MVHARATLRADRISRLTDPEFLSTIVDDVKSVEERPMGTVGFSGSNHSRYLVAQKDGGSVSLVLKRTHLDRDWIAVRSGDRLGREAMLLAAPELSGIWDIYASPYVAYAIEEGAIGVLMHDLDAYFVRDAREPLESAEENDIVGRLAALHAAYWQADLSGCSSWSARPSHKLRILAPASINQGPGAAPLLDRAREGWNEAFRQLPPRAADCLRVTPEECERAFAHLPATWLHGDVKVANFAFIPGGHLAAIDWALAGSGPVAMDLGWYLAVNASRLTCPKEELMRRYRMRLESGLGRTIDPSQWRDQERVAVWCGALMLLWSKALAVREGRPGAQEEWNWWVEKLAD